MTSKGLEIDVDKYYTADDVVVYVASDEDIKIAVARALDDAEITAEELKAEAISGRFRSENARLAWFSISPYI
jgi:hypothetical protein